jgi:hypothetical protein
VQHVEEPSAQLQRFGCRKFSARTVDVYVPADSCNRRNLGKRHENIGIPNISRVKNMLDLSQGHKRLGPKQAMCV